jgi:integrase
MNKFNKLLIYIKAMCDIPFKITASNFRKTFGSIIYYELDHPNKMGVIMNAYGHTIERTTRKYLGIQQSDLEHDHAELFG